jgi:hypothetical protein
MNYFNYFTEIEERFQQRRGSLLMLSTLDWVLIETWQQAGVPLEAVLHGIDDAFDKREKQTLRNTRRQRSINGLAWCAQAVLEATTQAQEASVGVATARAAEPRESGFEAARVARYLHRNATSLDAAAQKLAPSASTAASETATRLRELATSLSSPTDNLQPATGNLEETDRTLTVLEEKLFAALLASTPEVELVAFRAQADRELAPYRGKMQAVQIKQVQQQFLQKRLLEARALPRLSLFYMPHEDEA